MCKRLHIPNKSSTFAVVFVSFDGAKLLQNLDILKIILIFSRFSLYLTEYQSFIKSPKMTAKEVIKYICRENSITLRTLSQQIECSEQYLYDINSGKVKKIASEKAEAIHRAYPQYSVLWLMTGNEEYKQAPSAAETNNQKQDDKDKTIAELRAEVATLKEQVTNLTQAVLNLSSK